MRTRAGKEVRGWEVDAGSKGVVKVLREYWSGSGGSTTSLKWNDERETTSSVLSLSSNFSSLTLPFHAG
jgi:hypothetical protein